MYLTVDSSLSSSYPNNTDYCLWEPFHRTWEIRVAYVPVLELSVHPHGGSLHLLLLLWTRDVEHGRHGCRAAFPFHV